ncbi:hypothetical protein, partial [Microbacterium sp. B35-04]|uniref:hypothetical protein n=1 Tax=Microbacterium sp. B35-04 TaxID=1961716 RepID=UPI0019538C74
AHTGGSTHLVAVAGAPALNDRNPRPLPPGVERARNERDETPAPGAHERLGAFRLGRWRSFAQRPVLDAAPGR